MLGMFLPLLALIAAGAVTTAVERRQETPPPATLARLAWLAGSWAGGDASRVEEHWTDGAGGAMLATGRTVRGGRLVAFEFLRIVERDGSLVYIAQPQGRPPTEFALAAIDDRSVTFVNPAHDFPKEIRYSRVGTDGLEATVSDGGSKRQRFAFTRMPVP